jgi:hypothetical protein
MFGDWSGLDQRTRAQQMRLEAWLNEQTESCVRFAVIELGAGSAIPTVRHFAERVAHQCGSTLIRINLHEHDVPDGAIGLALGAAEALMSLAQNLPSKSYE